jgi:hypothetical protein
MDFYEEFDVAPTASLEEIHKAYRKLVRRHHPDNWPTGSPESANAEARMRHINEVYAQLSDPVLRASYDENHRRIAYLQTQAPYPNPVFTQRHVRWVALATLGLFVAGAVYVVSDSWEEEHQPRPHLGLGGAAPPIPSPALRSKQPSPSKGQHAKQEEAPRVSTAFAPDSDPKPAPPIPPNALVSLRPVEVSQLNQPLIFPSTGSAIPSAETVQPSSSNSGNFPAPSQPTPRRSPFAGVWIFTPKNAPPTSEQFAAEYIELSIRVDNEIISGSFRGVYNVTRSTLKPRVQFRFEGHESNLSQGFPWRSETGSEGMIKLHLMPGNHLEVGWYATKFASSPELTSGNAILTGDR